MSLVWLVLVSAISTIFAQSITSLFATNAQLSSLNDQIKNLTHFSAYLDGLADVTFLAPSNDALSTFFDSARGIAASSDPALLEAILTYHIQNGTWYQPTDTAGSGMPHFIRTKLSGSQYTNVTNGQYVEGVNDMTGAGLIYSGLGVTSKVITPNLNITNGLVHVIDTVLMIPQDISTTAMVAGLTAFIGAFTVAESLEVIDYSNDVTAFIPNNQAFASVASALENATAGGLASIMKYHVVQGNWPEFYIGTRGWTFGHNTTLTTMNGENISITTRSDGTTFVNSAQVITPNLLVANGVVHVIDNVLNPDNISATPDFSASTQRPAFSGATTVSGGTAPFTGAMSLPTASNDPGDATGHQGLGTGVKAGIGIGIAISVLSIMGLIVFLALYCRNCSSGPSRLQSGKRSHLIISGSTEVDPGSTRAEIDSNPVHEADGSRFASHELDGSPLKHELESRSNWPVEIDGHGIWPKEKDASFGHWSQP